MGIHERTIMELAAPHRTPQAGQQPSGHGSPDASRVAAISHGPSEPGGRTRETADTQTNSALLARRSRRADHAQPVSGWPAPADDGFRIRAGDCLWQSGKPDAGSSGDP